MNEAGIYTFEQLGNLTPADPLIQANSTNTQVKIIGGPVCTPVGERAYQWWQFRLPDGKEGWSAESPLDSPSYFLEPVP